jgi:hypothetical protein
MFTALRPLCLPKPQRGNIIGVTGCRNIPPRWG